jgi:hypothetical protein
MIQSNFTINVSEKTGNINYLIDGVPLTTIEFSNDSMTFQPRSETNLAIQSFNDGINQISIFNNMLFLNFPDLWSKDEKPLGDIYCEYEKKPTSSEISYVFKKDNNVIGGYEYNDISKNVSIAQRNNPIICSFAEFTLFLVFLKRYQKDIENFQ